MTSTQDVVLFVGLGAMGAPMARRLAAAGHRLALSDAEPARAAALAGQIGATAAPDPGMVPAGTVILMLPDSTVVEQVLGTLLDTLPSGAVVVDMGSSRPSSTVALAARAGERGVTLVDAPVSGGIAKARTGELSIMFGGPAEVLDRLRPLLAEMGTQITATGPVGSGHAMKALNNLLSGIGLVAASEVLAVGAKFGLEPQVMLDVLNASTGRNHATEVKFARHVLSRAFDSGFALRLMVKDLATALDLARETGTAVPLGAVCLQACVGAQTMLDDPAADHTEVARFVERNAGVELGYGA